ncbi:phospholipase A2 inhibitor gamma subunit B-like [Lithobates pipiens]
MNKIFVFLILSCLVITGQLTTTCNQCWNVGSTECCDERKFQCDGSDCMTSSEYCRIGGVDYRTILKGCSYEQLCDKCFSVTTKDDFKIRVSNVCGEGDGSNAELDYSTDICDRDLQPNGYQCPSCFTVGNTDGCESTGYVDCLGLEKECVDYGATVILSDGIARDLSVKGCATTGTCQIAFAGIPGGKELKRTSLSCTPAIPKE